MTKQEAFAELEKCRKRRKMLKTRPYDVTKELDRVKVRFDKAWLIAYGFPFKNVGNHIR